VRAPAQCTGSAGRPGFPLSLHAQRSLRPLRSLLCLACATQLAVERGPLPRLDLRTPRILQDVAIAGTGIVALLLVASRSGLEITGLVATSAVITAVVALSLQDTLGNVLGGLALQTDESIQVDDWIKVGDVNGRVVDIRWRYTAVETRNGETVLIPNSVLLKNQVMVLGRRRGRPRQWRRWVFFQVDYRHPPPYPPPDLVLREIRGDREQPGGELRTPPVIPPVRVDPHEHFLREVVGRFPVVQNPADQVRHPPLKTADGPR